MSRNTDTLNSATASDPAQPLPPATSRIRAALARLREIGERLPPVDAVAVIREGRALSEKARG